MHDDEASVGEAHDAPTLDVRGRAPLTAGVTIPREIAGYRILGKLGEGGMGIVFEAEQQHPHRRVALKVIRGGLLVDELTLRMFQRESETLARLAHPNIAAIYEAGRTDDGLHWFTMEVVRGRTLGRHCREALGGTRPTAAQLRERLRLFITVCDAVNHAHQRGVIHRDLKPSNIVVTETGDVKILDFGLARINDPEVGGATIATDHGTIKGTLPYMSPEQARGDSRDLDLRTDVYSLGVILYEMISGQHPYETAGSTVTRAIQTICETPPRSLRLSATGVPVDADLQTLTAKALEKDPERRYQSAGALAEDVERWLAGQPILAHPPSSAYLLRKFVARHRGRVAALAAIAVLAIALLLTVVVQARRVRIERDRATAAAERAGAINRFLVDALGGADPWQRGSRTVTLLDALRQAQAKVHAAFRDQPLVEASVLQTLGDTYGSLAEYAAADSALHAALALRERAAGPRSAEVVETLDGLAVLDVDRERYPEADSVARQALALAEAIHGPGALETGAALANLAMITVKEARLPEAKALAARALAIAHAWRASHGDGLADRIDPVKMEDSALYTLGEIAMQNDDPKAMVAIDRQRLAAFPVHDRSHDADRSGALNDLGTAFMYAGQLGAAESSYRQAIALARSALGGDHPLVALQTENLGNVYFREGRLDETARMLEGVLAIRRRALGDDAEPVARTLANMGTVYQHIGNLSQSEAAYREAIPRLARRLGERHPDVGVTRAGLGGTLRRERRFPEAELELRAALDILVRAYGDKNAMTQRAIKGLADLYTDWGRPAQAAPLTARLVPAK